MLEGGEPVLRRGGSTRLISSAPSCFRLAPELGLLLELCPNPESKLTLSPSSPYTCSLSPSRTDLPSLATLNTTQHSSGAANPRSLLLAKKTLYNLLL